MIVWNTSFGTKQYQGLLYSKYLTCLKQNCRWTCAVHSILNQFHLMASEMIRFLCQNNIVYRCIYQSSNINLASPHDTCNWKQETTTGLKFYDVKGISTCSLVTLSSQMINLFGIILTNLAYPSAVLCRFSWKRTSDKVMCKNAKLYLYRPGQECTQINKSAGV